MARNDQPPEREQTTARDLAKGVGRHTGKEHHLALCRWQAHFYEFEDTHFHFDSAVLLPDYSVDDPTAYANDVARVDRLPIDRVTGLDALVAVYRYAELFHELHQQRKKILVVGHTDRSGSEKYNLELSELRAANVLALLEGNRQLWVDICQRKHRVEDYQTILKWVHENLTGRAGLAYLVARSASDWEECDPGTVDNVLGDETRGATRVFQRMFNRGEVICPPPDIGARIPENGVVGPETWGAFFDVYMRVLEWRLLTDSDGLGARRRSLEFVDPPKAVGCGEYHPLTENVVENRISQIDRRVEIILFDQDQEPRLDCHPSPGVCYKDACEIYNSRFYMLTPINVQHLEWLVRFWKSQWLQPGEAPWCGCHIEQFANEAGIPSRHVGGRHVSFPRPRLSEADVEKMRRVMYSILQNWFDADASVTVERISRDAGFANRPTVKGIELVRHVWTKWRDEREKFRGAAFGTPGPSAGSIAAWKRRWGPDPVPREEDGLADPSIPERFTHCLRCPHPDCLKKGYDYWRLLAMEASLSAPEEVDKDARFEVDWTGPDASRDYLTIVPVGAPEGSYLSWAFTSRGSPATLTAPPDAGEYELRYVLGEGDIMRARRPITVR